MNRKKLGLILAVAAVLLISVSVAQVTLRQTPSPAMATVSFFSNNAHGYACFLNYTYPLTGAPFCLSDDPALDLPPNATVPLGNYTIVFFPFGTTSNQSTWLGTNNVQVTGSGAYDVSSSYANITVKGNGAIAVFVPPDNTTPVPEFPATGAIALLPLSGSIYLLRRRRR
jgi:hypothetical protein